MAVVSLAAFGMSDADLKMASALYQKKDWQALSNLASAAVRKDSKDGWAWYYSGLADDGLGRKDAAVAAYEASRNLIPGMMLGSVVQLLAQDYAALHQSAKLVALHQELQKSHPDLAQSLQSQFHDAIAAPAVEPAPEVSPRTLAALLANVRRTWRPDAIPVQVDVHHAGARFETTADFFSPSQKAGLMVVQSGGNATNLPVASPNWGVAPIPENFLPLDVAVARAPAAGAPGALEHAILYRAGSGQGDAINLVWQLAMQSGMTHAAQIAAFVLPQERFDALLRAAGQGDKDAQFAVSRVYALGLIGSPNAEQAFQWCNRAASKGDVEAEDVLGQMYQFGRGTRVDTAAALKWYQAAANAGFASAEYNLGLMHEMGIGVARNYVAAREWIEKAARQGLPEAQSELAYVAPKANGQARQAQAADDHHPVQCSPMYHWESFLHMCAINLGLVPTIK
jgi:tetratricopeptide (TPR) repeat protein